MDESFQLPVVYLNQTYHFDAQLHASSYHYKIEVLVHNVPFFFERDDEGNFRAIALHPDESNHHKIEPNLLQAIADTLHQILA